MKKSVTETVHNPQELEESLGESIKRLRLQKNLDQKTLCSQAGIGLTPLKRLEAGLGSTTHTLIRVVRALGRQDWIQGIAPVVSVNPLHMIPKNTLRQRARPISGKANLKNAKAKKS